MRICFIGDSSSIHVQRMVAYFVRRNDAVLVLSSAPYRSDIVGATTVHLLNSDKESFHVPYESRAKSDNFIAFAKSFISVSAKILILDTINAFQLFRKRKDARTEVQRFKPNVIFCNRTFPEGILARYCRPSPILLRTAGSDIAKLPKYPFYRRLIKMIIRGVDLVVTESNWERKLLGQLAGNSLVTEAIVIGVDNGVFRPPISKSELRDKFGIPRHSFVIVCSRSLIGVYNGWQIVESILSVIEECPSLYLLYLSPSRMDARSKKKADAIMAGCKRIQFLDRRIPHSRMPELLGCGDIYISFSSYDGIPNSVLEAMACGTVPIVAELPQLHEWIEHGRTGYFVQQRDVNGLASLIRDLYNNRERLPTIASRCVEQIRNHGSYESCMERTRELLAKLAESTRVKDVASSVSPSLKPSASVYNRSISD